MERLVLRGECQSLEMADSFFCWRKNNPSAVLGRFDHASSILGRTKGSLVAVHELSMLPELRSEVVIVKKVEGAKDKVRGLDTNQLKCTYIPPAHETIFTTTTKTRGHIVPAVRFCF
jgi:hypothetical protein